MFIFNVYKNFGIKIEVNNQAYIKISTNLMLELLKLKVF